MEQWISSYCCCNKMTTRVMASDPDLLSYCYGGQNSKNGSHWASIHVLEGLHSLWRF